MVRYHIDTMISHGYAEKLSSHDLDHGHMIFRKSYHCYESIEEALGDVRAIMYHTDEANDRWQKEQVKPLEKTQRSIIGYMDGRLIPAAKLLSDSELAKLPHWTSNGTINVADVS